MSSGEPDIRVSGELTLKSRLLFALVDCLLLLSIVDSVRGNIFYTCVFCSLMRFAIIFCYFSCLSIIKNFHCN